MLAIRVSGKLARADCERFEPEFERLLRQHGNLRLEFDMTAFHGLGRWRAGMATFCKPFTTATIQYFDQAEAADAAEVVG